MGSENKVWDTLRDVTPAETYEQIKSIPKTYFQCVETIASFSINGFGEEISPWVSAVSLLISPLYSQGCDFVCETSLF